MNEELPSSLTDTPSFMEVSHSASTATASPPPPPTRLTIPSHHGQQDGALGQPPPNLNLTPSESSNTQRFRTNYDMLLKEVLEEEDDNSNDGLNDSTLMNSDLALYTNLHPFQHLDSIDIDLDAATADLPDELRAALEDRSLADKYLADLKTFMSHQRSQSMGSMTSGKGDYSSPTTPLQPTFSIQSPSTAHHHPSTSSSSAYYHHRMQQDPLYKVLDAVPYQTRLINGVQSLWELGKKLAALKIPELDLPAVSDTVIKARLDDLYKVQDDLFIHLHGGPLVRNTHRLPIGVKKKHEIDRLLDQVAKEIGLYEEFVKRDDYLSLESILNESDTSDEEDRDSDIYDTESTSLSHMDSPAVAGHHSLTAAAALSHTVYDPHVSSSPPTLKKPSTLRRVTSQPTITHTSFLASSTPPPLITHSTSHTVRRFDSSSSSSSAASVGGAGSIHSYDAVSDPSLSQLLANDDDDERQGNEKQDDITSEAFKWTPLLKISAHLYSKDVRRTSGLVSVLAVSGVIAVGTTRSLVYVYDYRQNLKCVLGDTVRAVEVGAVTAVAISADHTTIVCGHSQGHLIVWDIRKPQHPIRTIEPIPPNQTLSTTTTTTTTTTNQAGSSRKEGHVRGAAILHVGFIGIKKSEIVSGDDQGMAFYHVLYKVVMVNAVDTTRILGRYQNLSLPSSPSSSTSTAAAATTLQPSLSRMGSSSSLLDSGTTPFNKPRRPSTVFAMQALPLGQFAHPAENFGLVALLTPYKMIIVGLKPSCQTKFKFLKPKLMLPTPMEQQPSGDENHPSNHHLKSDLHENLSGCLAWLPVTKATGPVSADKRVPKEPALEDPMLAYAWGNHLFIMRVGVGMADPPSSLQHSPGRFRSPMAGGGGGKRGTKLSFPKPAECLLEDPIIGLQWINRQILVLFTPNEEMLLFDPKKMEVTERASVRNKQLVYHDWFNAPLRDLTAPTSLTSGVVVAPNELDMGAATNTATTTTTKIVEMAYYHSLKGYKGKLFLLGLDRIYVGTLLSWVDRILALVRAGDFLDAIQLCTAFYNGKWTQTVVGLPASEPQRKQLVGEKLMELLVASLNYAFSPTRRSMLLEEQQTNAESLMQLPDRVEAPTTTAAVLYQDLAKCCVDACLSMGDTVFLFETAYEQFADHGVQGFFLQVLESYIVTDQLRDLPPAVMKDLVTHYSSAHSRLAALERIIWHVQPQCLDIDQVVGVCQREGLYEAMMYVWNKSMDDFVSPLVEMLKVIRQCLKNEGEPMDGGGGGGGDPTTVIQQQQRLQAEKVFDYLKMVLQGRTFPEGTMMRTSRGNEARSAVYSFVFSGRCVVWPRVGGKLILTVDENEAMAEPTYPYLRLLLRFNTKRFLDALESAFEDPWLNGGDDMLTSTFEEDVLQGKVISRQIIVNTLLDVMGGSGMNNNTNSTNNNAHLLAMPRLNPSFSASTVHSGVNGNNVKGSGTSSETTSSYYDGGSSGDSNSQNAAAAAAAAQNNHLLQLYIFIASNLHKYTTFILLPLTTKQKILLQLTVNDMAGYYYYNPKQPQQQPHHHHHHHRRYTNDESTKEERQRAVQQLLTVYTPNNEEAMTSLYEEAKFWNVLEGVYKRDKRYGKLVETYLKDTTPPSTRVHSSPASDGRHGNDDDDDDNLDDEEAITLARQHRVFNCVDELLDASSPLTDHQRQEVKRVVLIRISQFVDMDGQRTADLIQKYFGADHHDILRRLDEDEEFDDDDDDDNDDGLLENGDYHDGNGDHQGGKDESRFPVTFARVADKRIFSYLRGLLEPQPSSASSIAVVGGMERSMFSNGYSNLNGPILEEEEQEPENDDDDDEYVILNAGDDDTKNNIHSPTSTPVIRRTNIDIKLQERYIDLMCRFDPSGVYDYLNTKLFDCDHHQQPRQRHQRQKDDEDDDAIKPSDALPDHHQQYTTDGFEHVNFDTLLKSCDKYGVMDAAVWIMEKMGNIQGALEKMLDVGKEKIQMILLIIKQQQQQPWMFEDQSKISNGLIGLSGVLRVGIRLCENSSTYHSNSNDDDDDEIESLWFRLLDVYVEASMEIHSALKKQQCDKVGVQQHVITSFKSFVQSILTSLLLSTSPQVSLPRLLLRLIDSQTKGETTFADFRDIFLSMLDTYKYEGQLLALTNRLFDRDLFLGVQDMVRRQGKGWRPQTMACASCGIGILDLSLMQPRLWEEEEQEKAEQVMVFHCGHVFHHHCLDHLDKCTLCSTDKGKSKAITS